MYNCVFCWVKDTQLVEPVFPVHLSVFWKMVLACWTILKFVLAAAADVVSVAT